MSNGLKESPVLLDPFLDFFEPLPQQGGVPVEARIKLNSKIFFVGMNRQIAIIRHFHELFSNIIIE